LCEEQHIQQNYKTVQFERIVRYSHQSTSDGGAEFAGQENDGQRNFRGWKLQDWKMTDKVAGVENAGLEIDGHKCSR